MTDNRYRVVRIVSIVVFYVIESWDFITLNSQFLIINSD